jgi:hypothetical protein
MPGDVYNYMTSLSSNARQFFPLSSAYVDDPLAAVNRRANPHHRLLPN